MCQKENKMNPLVKKQLEKVKNVTLPKWDDDTLNMVIPKRTGEIETGLLENRCYLIKVEDYIINPFDGFTLHDNWNKGTHPIHHFMKCEVTKKMGKMIKVNSVGYDFMNKQDTLDVWEGWLPEKSITIIEEL